MWNNIIVRKLIIALVPLLFITLKGYASISSYSGQLQSLKGLLSGFSKAEKNIAFHFTKLKEKDISPLDLDFHDDAFFVSKEIVILESIR